MLRILTELIIRLARKQKEEKKKIEQQAEQLGLRGEEKQRYIHEELLRRTTITLHQQALQARKELEKIKEEAEKQGDWYTKRVAKELMDWFTERRVSKDPASAIAVILATEAIKQGLHRDPEKYAQFLLDSYAQIQRKILEELPLAHQITPEDHERFGNAIHPQKTIKAVGDAIQALRYYEESRGKKDRAEILKKYREVVEEVWKEFEDWSNIEKVQANPALLPLLINNAARRILGKEIATIELPQPTPTPGGRIFAHPDRYPTLTQKILLKTLILGKHLKTNNGVHRDLYRALRNLLTTPLVTSNWYPLLSQWFEELEKGNHKSPLTTLLEKIPINEAAREEAKRYLAKIEAGTPLNEIPEEEKKAFLQTIEAIKQEIWRNPAKYRDTIDQLVYTTGMNEKDAIKTLVGVIDDLARIYAGEKTPRKLGIERDALQVYHLIRNLPDQGNHIDREEVIDELRRIIEEHISDPLLRKAYQEAINHYAQTSLLIPRDNRYLDAILEEERKLEEKLRQMGEGETRITDTEARRIAMLYRTLMLLTPHSTLKKLKQFYSNLAKQLTIKVGGEEFLPVHGPVAEDTATVFSIIRRASPEEKEAVTRSMIARFEPLFHVAPHIEKKVLTILATTHSQEIPEEKHREFTKHLERTQVRRPIE